LLLIQLSVNVGRFVTLSTKLTKLRCFQSWELSSWDDIKNCLNCYRLRYRYTLPTCKINGKRRIL